MQTVLRIRLIMKFLMVFVTAQIFHVSCNAQWIDPHDMNTRAKSKLKSSSRMSEMSIVNTCTSYTSEDTTQYIFYLKRLVSLLVQSSTLDKSDPTNYQGHILFNINEENYNFLLNFVKGNTPELQSLRKLDTILSNSLGKNLHDEYLDVFLTFHDRLYHAVFSDKTLWLFGACVMFYIIYKLFKANFSISYIMGYLFFLVLIADFCLRYMEMDEEAREHNANIKYSSLCDTSKMSWTEYLQFMTSTRDCEKKVVTPLTVYLFQVKSLIIVPLLALGTGLGGFGKEMFVNLPWGLNLVMWPMMMLCSMIMFIFVMGFVTNKTIEFNFCHLLKLKFGGRSDGFHVTNMLTGKPLEKLLEAVNRPVQDQPGRSAIQEVSEPAEDVPTLNTQEVPLVRKKTQQQNFLPSRTIEKGKNQLNSSVSKKEDLNISEKQDNIKRQSELFEEKFKEQTEEFCTNHVVEYDSSTITDIGGSGDNPATTSILIAEDDNQNRSHFLDEIEKILEKPQESEDKVEGESKQEPSS